METWGDDLSEDGVINDRPLLERLAVAAGGGDYFCGWPPAGFRGRLFGGHLVAQAILACAGTVKEGRNVNSLHVYFLAPGTQESELTYSVERVRDGRTFSVRSVRVSQGGRLLVHASLSFTAGGSTAGALSAAMPAVPPPEHLKPLHERVQDQDASPAGFNWPARRQWWTASRPLDIRYVDDADSPVRSLRYFWFRAAPAVGSNQNEQRAVLAFASDRSLLPAVTKARLGTLPGAGARVASIDHALWFHGDVEAGEWYLYAQESPFSTPGLGTARGLIFHADGDLVASVAQQGVFSLPDATGARNPQYQLTGKE